MDGDWSISKYNREQKEIWNKLVAESRQGTLLHIREYVEYHADRFTDCSLLAYRSGKPIAVLPANISADGSLYSHQGLTYGGWLTPTMHFNGTDMLQLFDCWLAWCQANGINQIYYKPTPHIYHRIPAEEDLYALFRADATPWYTNLSTTIDMRETVAMNTLQRRHLKKSSIMGPWVRETDRVEEFMPMLEECLKSRHHSQPVHTAKELQDLKDHFPDQIRLFLCGTGEETEAEVCIYDTARVAHCQYIATTQAGRQNGTLTYLLHHLISDTFSRHRYFDFGTSNEELGRVLNSGLLQQKTGLGGRGIAYQAFQIKLP